MADQIANPVERSIALNLVYEGLKMGWRASVCDGDEWVVHGSQHQPTIMAALASTDYDRLRWRDCNGTFVGDIVLVWGNAQDLISDCTVDDNGRFDQYMDRMHQWCQANHP